jgi:hypothetical protein
MFEFHFNARDLDHLAMLVGLALIFLYGAGVRLRFDRVRFGVRTLFIATTLVALALGAIVYAVR